MDKSTGANLIELDEQPYDTVGVMQLSRLYGV